MLGFDNKNLVLQALDNYLWGGEFPSTQKSLDANSIPDSKCSDTIEINLVPTQYDNMKKLAEFCHVMLLYRVEEPR